MSTWPLRALRPLVELAERLSLALPFKPDELYRVPTDDGAAIALGRYHARGPRRFQEGVVLAHGLGANRYDLDLEERYSLARYLAERGYETWVLELRGRGLAGPAADASFDAEAEHDVTAALRTVRAAGSPAVAWIGHSKGGLLAYAHLAKHPEAPIRAGVGLGSPGTYGLQHGLKRFIKSVAPLLKWDALPTRKLTALAPFGAPPGPVTRYMLNVDNIEPDVLRRSLANVPADVAGSVARQLAGWIASGRFDSVDGHFDYRAGMARVRTPFFLVAGARDLLAPPPAVRVAEAALGGPTEVLVLSRAHGFSADYGHADLVLGRNAPEEVFPRVEGFLARTLTPV